MQLKTELAIEGANMLEIFAGLMSAWCYVLSLTIVLYVIPYRLVRSRFHVSLRLGVFLFAIKLLIRGSESWNVAIGITPADWWYFVNAISPAAATVIIGGDILQRSAKVIRSKSRRKSNFPRRVFSEPVA